MDLSAHTSLTPLAEAVAAVLAAAAAAPHEIYIAGALARDLWLEFAYAINTGRRTEDVDFAVECADWDAFAQLRATLLAAGDVVPGDASRHRFRHRNGTLFDLLPYGGVERRDRTLAWPPGEHQVMNALGFAEVAATTVLFRLPTAVEVRVVPLHALALLKLVAWDDRRLPKDAHDLFFIATKYVDAGNDERLFEEGLDIVLRSDFDHEVAGAELLGRDLAPLFRRAPRLRTFVTDLLLREVDPRGMHLLASQMARFSRADDLSMDLLLALQREIEFEGAAP
jgi:predicted nucleotidyltransferase